MGYNEDEYNQNNPLGLESDSDLHRTRRNFTGQIIRANTSSNGSIRILDVRCGNGSITKLVATNFPKIKIYAIDIVEKAIEPAKLSPNEINYICADGMNYTGMGFYYDIILLNNIDEYIENPCGMLLNLKTLLTEKGSFIISTLNHYYYSKISHY